MNTQAQSFRRILFTDLRHIQCGHLSWGTPDGRRFGVSHPPEPQVEMHAQPRYVPHGVRLVAQPARKTEPVTGWRGWGRIIYDQGMYRSWYLTVDGHSLQGSGSRSQTDDPQTYDASIERYVLYTRMYRQDRRWIGRAESDDFLNWGPIEPMIWPGLDDPLDHDVYLNGYTTYPGSPEYRLMFPMFYHRATERSDVRLYSSEDGIVWNRVPGGPALTPGETGSWDSEFIAGGKDLIPLGEGRIAIPYIGTPYPHKYPRWPEVFEAWRMGWAWWPEGRLCAVRADDEGEFWTFPLVPSGRSLRLNFRTPRGGEVRVGLEGVAGRSADDCDPMHGDQPAQTISWRGQTDIGMAEGQAVVLHFKMRCAEVFGVEWT
ncbi:MAG: hypothetical protein A3F84_13315 [Candidatus Handelsmanbacteria bacterium RIFCSPLOWO2_12_FULL_64_10]|uniref:Glycosyl hydrolase family 32 N-terminal domain-containing protein n=1 Tax=Handelsmanbacteria sp. (strain RIFCSPLOWO2_12_FULL_64_10) TaxID=1817868 RepID=A0A1F6C3I3_HANXR|nr:MAG: hypothetical protein A3F84_13315 [Candidatus Handelsmanbacteria bacterium RIFCSPLOWO2_12_FULL_64_10]